MRLTLRMILLLIAVVLFVLAAVGVDLGSLAIVPLGLAFFAGAFLVPDTVVAPAADRPTALPVAPRDPTSASDRMSPSPIPGSTPRRTRVHRASQRSTSCSVGR
jgi:hypothetical protein